MGINDYSIHFIIEVYVSALIIDLVTINGLDSMFVYTVRLFLNARETHPHQIAYSVNYCYSLLFRIFATFKFSTKTW